jgi:transcriptional regulator with XRE-family HTH domain
MGRPQNAVECTESGELYVGSAIRVRRERQRWSIEELARRVPCHQATLSKIETNAGKPSTKLVEKIATALGVPHEELLRAPLHPRLGAAHSSGPEQSVVQFLPSDRKSLDNGRELIELLRDLLIGQARLENRLDTLFAGQVRLENSISALETDLEDMGKQIAQVRRDRLQGIWEDIMRRNNKGWEKPSVATAGFPLLVSDVEANRLSVVDPAVERHPENRRSSGANEQGSLD